MSKIVINIEMPVYLKKYLLLQSCNKVEPVVFRRDSSYNYMLIKFLQRPPSTEGMSEEERKAICRRLFLRPDYNKHLSVIVPFSDRKDVRTCNYIGIHKAEKFRNEIRDEFTCYFKRFLIQKMKADMKRKDAVNEFLDMLNLGDEELKFDTLYKYSSRIIKKWTI